VPEKESTRPSGVCGVVLQNLSLGNDGGQLTIGDLPLAGSPSCIGR
jgi:hypothetical protein